MKIVVVAVGKVKDRALRAVIDDYVARIRRYVTFNETEVRDDASLSRAIPAEATVVACEVTGEQVSSQRFAERIEGWACRQKGVVVFLIGGAEGIPRELSRAADARVSLSSMTLPHRLARLVLAEQIYRALTIIRGEPYARES